MHKHITRHRYKRNSHKRHNYTHKRHSKRHNKSHKRHRKRRQIVLLPGSQSIPIFTTPQKKYATKIAIDKEHNQSGNIISGLRDYIKNM
jgi:hypothetical protein